MSRTDNFRKQHDELLEIVGKIAGQLDAEALSTDASGVRHDLSKLAGKISMHLAMEDKSLYPAMVASSNASAKSTAEQFQNEMGDLAGAFKDFNSKWITPSSIQSDAAGFINEVSGIAQALQARIEKENNVLYPLADQV